MEDPQLRSALERLDTELRGTRAGNAEDAPKLDAVHGQVQELLNQPTATVPEHHASFRERLRELVPAFEATHPTLTLAVNEMIDLLDRMGL